MPIDKKKLAQILALAILVLVFFTILFATGILKWPKPPKPPYDTGGGNITSAVDAESAALKVALGWHEDAVLSSIDSNKVANPGEPINSWQFIFTSPGAARRGFLVRVSTARVESFEEISYTGTAAPLPTDIISQGEAIKRVHQIKGYENAPVLGIEAVYDPVKKSWFWAARTPRGVVSVEAKQ